LTKKFHRLRNRTTAAAAVAATLTLNTDQQRGRRLWAGCEGGDGREESRRRRLRRNTNSCRREVAAVVSPGCQVAEGGVRFGRPTLMIKN